MSPHDRLLHSRQPEPSADCVENAHHCSIAPRVSKRSLDEVPLVDTHRGPTESRCRPKQTSGGSSARAVSNSATIWKRNDESLGKQHHAALLAVPRPMHQLRREGPVCTRLCQNSGFLQTTSRGCTANYVHWEETGPAVGNYNVPGNALSPQRRKGVCKGFSGGGADFARSAMGRVSLIQRSRVGRGLARWCHVSAATSDGTTARTAPPVPRRFDGVTRRWAIGYCRHIPTCDWAAFSTSGVVGP